MALTTEERQRLREEESFRAEVRSELAAAKPPPGALGRVAAFFESKAGFWLLTTVLATGGATGYTWLQQQLHRDEIERQERAERSRRDTETLLKLGPLLTSDKRSQVDMALVLLDGLVSDQGVDSRVPAQVKALVSNTLAAGLQQNASAEERAQANAIIAYVDRPPAAPAAASDAGASPRALAKALDAATLPPRVYLHINDEADRDAATRLRATLVDNGVVVPGIERVASRSYPHQASLRYCAGKVDDAMVARVIGLASAPGGPAPAAVVLDPSLCTKVRFNHFELWFAARGAAAVS